VSTALIQSGTETLPGFWTLIIYLVPAGVALGLVIAVIIGRRRRRMKSGKK
jgi:NhaP-type Na+/H+ or K+/H+ antiporter